MADLNPLRIEDFPELTSLLSTDQIVFFEESDSTKELMPKLVYLSAFSEIMSSYKDLEDLQKKASELESLYKEVEREFTTTYVTHQQVSQQYSDLQSYNRTKAQINTTASFDAALTQKADKNYLDAKFNELKNVVQDMKRFIGSWAWTNGGEKAWGYKRLAVAAAAKGYFSN